MSEHSMRWSERCLSEQQTGYRREQLAAAFETVRNQGDWQAPIRATIPAAERPLVEQAVLWFTDTVPVFLPAPGHTGRLLVRAPGYRLGPAGDRASGPRSRSIRPAP